MNLQIPNMSLVILIGASGSGKSTFARTHFRKTEVVSSDECRGFVSDDENDQAATKPAFELLHFMIEKRLELGKLTVVDATNVQAPGRKRLVELARQYHVLPVAIAFKMSEDICNSRNSQRPDRQFGPHVVRNQMRDLRQSLNSLRREGFRHVFVFDHPDEVAQATIERTRLWNDLTDEHGPFDIIGDVHGCYPELLELLAKLGYRVEGKIVTPPAGRRAIFLGDLVDRGPNSPAVLRLVMQMVADGVAMCVPGNHDIKLMRKLKGADVKINHGLELTLAQLANEPPEFGPEVVRFIDAQVSHYLLDDHKLVVAHAGMKESMQGRGSGQVRDFALFGETTGESDEFGLPVRYKWAEDYRGNALVVYGHTPVPEADWLNNTVCIDTGCVFGGKLSALRYPERDIVSVEAKELYCEPVRPLHSPTDALSSQQISDDMLDIEDVRGRQHVRTNSFGTVVIEEENAIAALEIMSRFGANPKWLVYLPPTMSPCETSRREGFLEHPEEAFAYYRDNGVHTVVCEEKHMGSRAVVVVCRDQDVARERFGVVGEGIGIVVTRTGRRFFEDMVIEQAFLQRISAACSSLWAKLDTDWVVLDCELMPWSAKAQELITRQYAPVGASASANLKALSEVIQHSSSHVEMGELLARTEARLQAANKYVEAYRHYCWPTPQLEDYKLAPFHILATEGAVHTDKNHEWHMSHIHEICTADKAILRTTPWITVNVDDDASLQAGVDWWLTMTSTGGEGMVVKPYDFVVRSQRGIVQPAIKCRGPEYLRIIYGPEYLLPGNLDRLRKRGLSRKRSLAQREFGLGIEALERFVRGEPLRRVHQCVFGVLALESEPVDPRL